jgi:hypothetical protein
MNNPFDYYYQNIISLSEFSLSIYLKKELQKFIKVINKKL